MSKSMRHIPKEIAIFGEKQFKETGALLVEILRVKTSTIRKHFKHLKAITFLVAVITLDRVRIYFFDTRGIMLFAENINHEKYKKVRKASRLLGKFEKPTPPTPEEIRMELTEELRIELSKAMKRISRELDITEKDVPVIFVTKNRLDENTQSFAMVIGDDDEFIINESSMNKLWFPGLVYRIAFLHYANKNRSDFTLCVANAIAAALLKDTKSRDEWLKVWAMASRGTNLEHIANHLVQHLDTYGKRGFSLLMEVIQRAPEDLEDDTWEEVLALIHDGLDWAITTNEYFDIERFCKTLNSPKKLVKKQWLNPKIHLAPRVVVNPSSLGLQLSIITQDHKVNDAWADIAIIDNGQPMYVTIMESDKALIKSFYYWLDLKSIAGTKTGGAKNTTLLRSILKRVGIEMEHSPTYEVTLHFNNAQLDSRERAVLERLNEGRLKILSNSLIGSPEVISSLLERGNMIMLPNLQHISVKPEYYVNGKDVLSVVKEHSIEITIFTTDDTEHAIVSIIPGRNRNLLRDAIDSELRIAPVISTSSCRGLLRHEEMFPDELVLWGSDSYQHIP